MILGLLSVLLFWSRVAVPLCEFSESHLTCFAKDLSMFCFKELFFSACFVIRLGPMDTELKERKRAVYRKRTKPGEGVRPDEVRIGIY